MMFRVLLLSEMAKNPRVGVYLVFAVARLYRELSAFTAVFSENRRCFFRRFAAANPLFMIQLIQMSKNPLSFSAADFQLILLFGSTLLQI